MSIVLGNFVIYRTKLVLSTFIMRPGSSYGFLLISATNIIVYSLQLVSIPCQVMKEYAASKSKLFGLPTSFLPEFTEEEKKLNKGTNNKFPLYRKRAVKSEALLINKQVVVLR